MKTRSRSDEDRFPALQHGPQDNNNLRDQLGRAAFVRNDVTFTRFAATLHRQCLLQPVTPGSSSHLGGGGAATPVHAAPCQRTREGEPSYFATPGRGLPGTPSAYGDGLQFPTNVKRPSNTEPPAELLNGSHHTTPSMPPSPPAPRRVNKRRPPLGGPHARRRRLCAARRDAPRPARSPARG